MLSGQMMPFPLTFTHVFERAAALFPDSEIVSRAPDRGLRRTTMGAMLRRSAQLMHALTRLGVRAGDRVATLCWNHDRHLEIYMGVPTMGAVLHTLNLRLHPSELAFIARHAGDRIIVADRSLLPLLDRFVREVPCVEHVIVIDDTGAGPVEGTLDYEALLAPEPGEFPLPVLDENAAAILCYTSGTTGEPKGVVYSHRSNVLHSLVICMADMLAVSERDTALPVVPMFHANAWGIPFSAVMAGAKIVFPGPHMDPDSLLDLMAGERVSFAGGVPTIWLGILARLDAEPQRWDLSAMRSMVIGGSAAPPSLIDGFRGRHGLIVQHAWGMTEMNPLGTVASLRRSHDGLSDADKLHIRASQGRPAPFVETRHTDDTGRILPWDGATQGELEVRGPWVASAYFGGAGPERFTADGWFKTGDVVTIDPQGYVRITDRSKDVIKSGGEWISSVALENALMAHPAVLEAAVFAGRHPKWDERPIAAVVFRPGQSATPEALREHLAPSFAAFWLPDAFVAVEQIPRTSTGKFLKSRLRELYGELLMDAPKS